jgi:minor extracellular serine protease Vpr
MKSATIGAIIVSGACFFGAGAMEALSAGTFPIVQSQDDSAQQVRRAAKTAAAGCTHIVEVSALVDNSFSPASLVPYGWRLVTRMGEVVTLQGCASSLPALGTLPGIRYVKLPSRVYPEMDSARKLTHVNQVHDAASRGGIGRRFTGKGVLFGILDMEFDTHHPAFLDSNRATRFLALWDQTDTTKGIPRNRFGYGQIKNHAQLLTDSVFGLGPSIHGTFMTSYAAGSEWKCPYYGVAPDVKIVGVKIGPTDQNLIDGLSWLDSLADSLKMPCVVNMSLGNAEGPHDGTSLVDRAIDNFSAIPGRIVVGAAGNDGGKKCHIAFPIGKTAVQGSWIKSAQTTSSSGRPEYFSGIDLWADSGNYFAATFYILDTSTAAKTYRQGVPRLSTATTQHGITPLYWTNTTTGRRDTLVFEDSVERASPLNARPHCRVWMLGYNPALILGVTVVDSAAAGGSVHAWNMYKSAFMSLGMTGFYDGDTVMCVNELGGTAKRNITVGAYSNKLVFKLWNGQEVAWNGLPNPVSDSGAHRLQGTSGRGPTLDGRVKPDIVAPGHDVVGAMPRNMPNNGMIAWPADTHSTGRYTNNGGTSVAAPIVAGIVALMLEANPQLTVEDARRFIQQTAITDAITGIITTPNNSWGAGRVNAAAAIGKMLNIPLGYRGGVAPGLLHQYSIAGIAENTLRLNGLHKGEDDKTAVDIFAMNGRLVLHKPVRFNAAIVAYKNLPQGIYIARAIRKGETLCSVVITKFDR